MLDGDGIKCMQPELHANFRICFQIENMYPLAIAQTFNSLKHSIQFYKIRISATDYWITEKHRC